MSKHHLPGGALFFTVSGTGVAVGSFRFFSDRFGLIVPTTRHNAKWCRIVVRQEAGGTATACTIYGVHKNHAGAVPSAIPQEYVPFETDSLTPTADAVAAFLDSPIDAKPLFQESSKLMIDVTAAAGDWTFTGYIEMEGA